MKIFVLISSLMILFFSCKQDIPKNTKTNSLESVPVQIVKEDIINPVNTRNINTASGKTFEIQETKVSSSLSNISIQPKGFSEVNELIKIEDSNPISDIFLTDLDRDHYNEIIIITRSAGSGSYATIYGYASNKDKSITPVYFPEIAQSDLATDGVFYGFRGKDSIYHSSRNLFRKFPVYNENDNNCCPTGGNKTITYKFKKGKTSWRFEVID